MVHEVHVPEGVAAAEEGPEHLKGVHGVEGEVPVETGGGGRLLPPPPAGSMQPVLSVPVEGRPLVGIAEHLVRLCDLLEPFLSVRGLVLVRVELQGHLAVALLDVILGGVPSHAQHAVVVFSHLEFVVQCFPQYHCLSRTENLIALVPLRSS